MRAAIYNPYLDTLGGGERYTMAFAQALQKNGFKVNVQWNEVGIGKKLEERFGIKLTDINFVKDIKRGDGYDVCFWVSDGSIPLLRARKNFLHFQIPFRDVNGKSLMNRMKFFRINRVICNSNFTKKYIDHEYGVASIVLYPPIDVARIKAKRKKNIILSVGRFSQLTQAKGQVVLIDIFKKLSKKGGFDYELILAGGAEVGADKYLKKLKNEAEGYAIRIIESPSFKDLLNFYGHSKIFWSASGYGIDENKDPKRVEHFGITVVEAMASGAVPLAFSAGGHKEIINDGENGFLWKTKIELIKKTQKLLKDGDLLRRLSQKARIDSKVYEYAQFETKVRKIIKGQ